MQFLAITRIYRNPDDPVSLRNVWIIGDGEFKEGGKSAWTYLRDENELASCIVT